MLSLAELVRRTGLHKATVHRLAKELVANRLLDRVDDGYRPQRRARSNSACSPRLERSLLEMAMPFLQDLYERTHETVHLGVRDGHDVVYVAKIGGHRQANAPSRTGGRIPLHCSAIGKALLANSDPELRREVLSSPMVRRTPHTVVAPGILRGQLDKVVETGVAFEREESALGIACVAAPVFGPDDRIVAAISVTGPTTRYRPESQVDAVRAAAEGLRSTMSRRERLR